VDLEESAQALMEEKLNVENSTQLRMVNRSQLMMSDYANQETSTQMKTLTTFIACRVSSH
jgi:hypothetical protein